MAETGWWERGDDLRRDYNIELETLGVGGQGVVRTVRRKSDGRLFACKSIRVTDYKDGDTSKTVLHSGVHRRAETEITVHDHLSRKMNGGVPELINVYREREHYHLVMEKCQCSLWNVVLEKKRFTELEGAQAIKRLAGLLDEMHKNGVVHRDIKLDNVFVQNGDLKLADFGCSWMDKGSHEEVMSDKKKFGTTRYVAPEVASGKEKAAYDKNIDVWGVGIILYELLSGTVAFDAVMKSEDLVARLGRMEDLPMTSLDWSNVSEEAKAFILDILRLDPTRRLSLSEIQQHPWVQKHTRTHEGDDAGKSKRKRDGQLEAPKGNKIRLCCKNGIWQTVS